MCSGGCRRDNCYHGFMQPLPILMVALFLAIMVISCYLYIKLIATGVESNQIGFIISFLPSAILTIIGWFVTKGKFLKLMFPQESNPTRNSSQVDPPTEQTPLNASMCKLRMFCSSDLRILVLRIVPCSFHGFVGRQP